MSEILFLNKKFDCLYINKKCKNTGTSEYPFSNMKSTNIPMLLKHLDKRHNNLKDINLIFKKHNVKWYLAGGTLLGAVRDNELILNDYDDDITILSKISNKCFDDMLQKGFKICRSSGDWVVSIIRDGAPIDFCFKYELDKNLYTSPEPRKFEVSESKEFYNDVKTIKLRGIDYPILNHVEKYLEFRYYKDWRTPNINGIARGCDNDKYIVFLKEEKDNIDIEKYNNIKCLNYDKPPMKKPNIYFV